jgi:putative aldouronate transport system permease protein
MMGTADDGSGRARTGMAGATHKPLAKRAGAAGKPRRRIFKREEIPLHIMAAPTIIATLLFSYVPIVWLVIAFQDYRNDLGVFGSPFVGFKNFKFLFASTDAFVITRNTVLYNAVFISLNMALSIALAISMNMMRTVRYAKVIQTIIIMPTFLAYPVL